MTSYYVDVHAHLTDTSFDNDRVQVIHKAQQQGFKAIVVNGLDPITNRQTQELSRKFSIIKPALGIYPVHAINHLLPEDFALKITKFNVDDEIKYIKEQALNKQIIAVGECGLDGYWPDSSTFAAQERVFSKLIEIAKDANIPIIVHSRKLEKRCLEILATSKHQKVVMHCFGGKTKLALKYAEQYPWCFSIPANCNRNQGFQKLLRFLPLEQILTETDSPYLSPTPGTRNTPLNAIGTVTIFSQLRDIPVEEAKALLWKNYQRIFAINATIR